MQRLSIGIRRAVPDDANAIAEVHVVSWQTTYPGLIDDAYLDSLSIPDRAAKWIRRLSADGESAPDIIVATASGGQVIGFLSGGAIRDPYPGFDAELHAIYLLKEFQGSGIGRRLVREWASIAVERGHRSAVVRALSTNPYCAFYERLGASLLRETELDIGGKLYPERWYGWRDLRGLTTLSMS